jgi:hypothetical protein
VTGATVPSWNELLNELESKTDAEKGPWIAQKMTGSLTTVSTLRASRNVIYYGSAFLQKPQAPAQSLQITGEDLNGFMSVIYGMDFARGLTLILHTPGGLPNAAETIVAYLRSKFRSIEVIVPTFAMSAGTMVSLASDRVVMGRQSQLGPIDPQLQLPTQGRFVSARAIVEQFDRAKTDIGGDLSLAHVWAPALASLGPALLQEAQNALAYGEDMVARWLAQYMFRRRKNRADLGKQVAKHFNDASTHKSHGRRIDRAEARKVGVVVEDLEPNPDLQDAVLTAYHLTTLLYEKSPTVKLIWSHADRQWIKNWQPQPRAVGGP